MPESNQCDYCGKYFPIKDLIRIPLGDPDADISEGVYLLCQKCWDGQDTRESMEKRNGI